jgi:hypothetical protein
MQLKFRSIISTNQQLLKVVGIKQSGHVANTRGILFNVIKFRAPLTHQSSILLQNKYLLCAPRAKMIHPSKQTDQAAEWRQTVRRRITCMHLLSHSDGINQKGFNGERDVETI